MQELLLGFGAVLIGLPVGTVLIYVVARLVTLAYFFSLVDYLRSRRKMLRQLQGV